ncbi:allantoinase AllB [Robertmurraya massiliosenegalensis]|uniref:allantoinase AllB n=1 Tax=Robertmurraya massiliosenegalensis TaxID=1287657 RepID=UPI0002D3A9B5|nr:allantoinase AllB [Robertmurraya massiliosenegalensis]
MKFDLLIKNGIIVSEKSLYKGSIYVKDGKIEVITSAELSDEAIEIVNAEGKYIFPGFIDTHVHSRDPGATYKEDFYHSTQAAAAGGVTTIFEMPNTNPPINNVANLQRQIKNLESKAFVNFGIWAICLGKLNLEELTSLHQSGVIGFKFFWGYAVHSQTFQLMYNYHPEMKDVIPPFSDGEVFEMFQEVAKTGQVFAIHAENSDLIQYLTQKVSVDPNRKTYLDLLEGRPNLAEELTIQAGISMAKKTGARLHVLHVSTAEGIQHIRQAQKEGYPITAETCPHYLFLSAEDYEEIGPKMKVYPPVKFKKDQEELWNALRDGTISLVCSDHAPHTEEEKEGDLWSIPAGMCGVESLVPLMINAVNEEKISIFDLRRLLSEGPAKLFGLESKGEIKIGADADITIVDMDKKSIIKSQNLHSKSKVTAFDGFNIKGMPVQTIVGGKIVMKNGEIIGKPSGSFVTPN